MVFLVQGTCEMVKNDGACVGRFTDGASFGEIAILGIFATRPSTVRALTKCRVLKLSRAILMRVLGNSAMERQRKRFESITAARREQTVAGMPICALPMAVEDDDVCARAVALQAEQIDLEPGETLDMLSDRSPCGPHFSVLVRGRVTVEMKITSDPVMTLMQGSLLLEGMLADFGARIRAKIPCEIYRVRNSDFMIAVSSVPMASDWFYRFRLLEKETRERFLLRLKSARGAIESCKNRPRTAPAALCDGAAEFSEESSPARETLPPARPQTAAAHVNRSVSSASASPSRSGTPQAWRMRPNTACAPTKKPEHTKLEPLDTPTNRRSQEKPIKTEAYAWATPQRGRMQSGNRRMLRTPSATGQRKLLRVSSAPVRNPRHKMPTEQLPPQDQPWSGTGGSFNLFMKPVRQRCASAATQRSEQHPLDESLERPLSHLISSKILRQRCVSGQRIRDPSQTF